METAPLTLHLLGAIGLYMAAISAGGLLAPERWQALGAEMERAPGLAMVMGVVAYAIGVALLGVHHGLADPLQILVTAVGAAAVLEGLLLLAVPKLMTALGGPFFARPRLWAIATLILGLAFIAVALLGRAL